MSPINSGTKPYDGETGTWVFLLGGRDAAIERMLPELVRTFEIIEEGDGGTIPTASDVLRDICEHLLDAAAGEKP